MNHVLIVDLDDARKVREGAGPNRVGFNAHIASLAHKQRARQVFRVVPACASRARRRRRYELRARARLLLFACV